MGGRKQCFEQAKCRRTDTYSNWVEELRSPLWLMMGVWKIEDFSVEEAQKGPGLVRAY